MAKIINNTEVEIISNIKKYLMNPKNKDETNLKQAVISICQIVDKAEETEIAYTN